MKRIDRIKNLIALGLLALVLIPFTFLGKDHDFTRYAAAFGIISWMIIMFWSNRMKKKNQE